MPVNSKECIPDMNSKSVLLVFARSPEAGNVKTRLIPDIGIDAATALYKELLSRTLNTSIQSVFSDRQLWVSGNTEHSFFKSFNKNKSFKIFQQTGTDLGEKMFNAFDSVLTGKNVAILIGSDCPSLCVNDLSVAVDMLEGDKDIVLGPAKDGGYYLIGLKQNNNKLFTGIEWGTDKVFSTTVSIAEDLNFNVGLLEMRDDVDRLFDLKAYEKLKKQECTG